MQVMLSPVFTARFTTITGLMTGIRGGSRICPTVYVSTSQHLFGNKYLRGGHSSAHPAA
jgi:hypothetical protein